MTTATYESGLREFGDDTPLEAGITLVEANAGTGKTYQIENIFLRLATEVGLDVRSVVLVTFSERAANELKERIRHRLASELRGCGWGRRPIEDSAIDRARCLRTALSLFDQVHISTIHGFCNRVLRQYSLLVGLPTEPVVQTDSSSLVRQFARDFVARKAQSISMEEEEALLDILKQLLEKKEMATALEEGLPGRPSQDEVPEEYVPLVQLRDEALEEIARRLDAHKRRHGILTYHDMLARLLHALRDPAIGQSLKHKLQERYRVAIIDEFQDTDPIQWEIFHELFGDGKEGRMLFVIGDPKQLIYGFRNADPDAYREARGRANHVYGLTTNYRSDSSFVEAVNALFGRPDSFLREDVSYGPSRSVLEDRLVEGPGWPEGRLWVRFCGGPETPLVGKDETRKLLADTIALDVGYLLSSGARIKENGALRNLRPTDICVLVRENRHGEQVADALKSAAIPAIWLGPGNVLQSTEAEELALLVAAAAAGSQSRYARGALLTRLVGLDVESLEDVHAVAEARARLSGFIDALKQDGVLAAVRHLLFTPRRGGLLCNRKAVANYLQIAEKLEGLSRTRGLGLEGLCAAFSRVRTGVGSEQEEAPMEATEQDAVTVMTAHQSKGLQFGIVLVASAWTPPQVSGPMIVKVTTPNRGRSQRVLVYPYTTRLRSSSMDSIRQQAKRSQEEEEARLAYVAVTRARHAAVVYVPPYKNLQGSYLGHLLGISQVRRKELTSATILDAIHRLVRAPGLALWTRPPVCGPSDRTQDSAPREQTVAIVRYGRGGFAKGKTVASFSSLVGGHGESDDEWWWRETETETGTSMRDGLLAYMAPGTDTGTFFHSMMQTAMEKGRRRASALAEQVLGKQNAEQLARDIDVVMGTDLGDGFTLAALSPGDFQCEMRFSLHVDRASFDPRSLALLLRSHLGRSSYPEDYPEFVSRLAFERFQGLLVGSLDLFFRHDGKYHLLDYKTNDLGDAPEYYEKEALCRAMADHHYYLQGYLYSAAVHRYLGAVLEDYDYERDFGGMYYLFVRGMKWPGHGVFHERPPQALLDGILELLQGE